MSEIPEDLFEQLYKRAPTQADKDRLLRVKAALGLSARDELWAVILTLDHYTSTNQTARNIIIKEMNQSIKEIKSIRESAGQVALVEAQKAVSLVIDQAADKIAKVAVKKSETRADQISKRKLIVAVIAGAFLTIAIATIGSAITYLVLDAKGMICEEPPFLSKNGISICVVDRNQG